MNKLSVVIITLNEEQKIERCLESIKNIADEIIVVDSFSSDKTEEICMRYNKVVFIKNKFENYGQQKSFAIEKASFNWILSIDADEYLSDELMKEINLLKKQEPHYHAYYIYRNNLYQGKILRFGGFGKEKILRLFDKKYAKISISEVHEKVISDEKIGLLKNKMIHSSFKSLEHEIEKLNKYTSIYAHEASIKGKKCSKINVVTKFGVKFLFVYLCKLSFLDGYAGFNCSLMNAYYTYLKYAKLYELNQNKKNN